MQVWNLLFEKQNKAVANFYVKHIKLKKREKIDYIHCTSKTKSIIISLCGE